MPTEDEAKYGLLCEAEWKICPKNVKFCHLKMDLRIMSKSGESDSSAKIFENLDFQVKASFKYFLENEVTPRIFCGCYKSNAELQEFLREAGEAVILKISEKIFSILNGLVIYKNSLSTEMAAMNMARLFGDGMREKIKRKDGHGYIQIDINEFRWPGND